VRVGPPSARGEGDRLQKRARPERSASANPGTSQEAGPADQPAGADPQGETKAPAKPVEAARFATVDAGAVPAASITSGLVPARAV
jgi:hypothetical protein